MIPSDDSACVFDFRHVVTAMLGSFCCWCGDVGIHGTFAKCIQMLIVKNEEVIVTLAVAILVEKPLSHKDHGITYIILTILVGEHTFFFHFGSQSGRPYGRILSIQINFFWLNSNWGHLGPGREALKSFHILLSSTWRNTANMKWYWGQTNFNENKKHHTGIENHVEFSTSSFLPSEKIIDFLNLVSSRLAKRNTASKYATKNQLVTKQNRTRENMLEANKFY